MTNWQDSNPVSIPSNVLSSDLFDGELLGDELIDIYNAAVVEGSEAVISNEIPMLLPHASDCDESKKPDDIPSDGFGVQVPVNDGLGSFGMSPSLNDLTELLPTPTTSGGSVVESAKKNSNSIPSAQVQSVSVITKRVYVPPENVPPTKKHCTGLSRTPYVNAQSGAAANFVPSSPKANEESQETVQSEGNAISSDTPNPLTLGNVNPVPVKKTIAVPGSVSFATTPAVVSPVCDAQVKGDTSPVLATSVPVPDLTAPSAGMATEADFKSVAQAAVSSLIMNVGASAKTDSQAVSQGIAETVDTTTAHIKALTGSNWVAAITAGPGCSVSSSADADAKANVRGRRQNLTADERAKQNRDRNREHARNTRLRKKAYVEELKRTLMELVAQRDATELIKRQTAQRDDEQREVRFRVIEEFLKLRGRNEPDSTRWSAIVEDGFSLTLPVTGFRKMVHVNKLDGAILEQGLCGVPEVMADSKNLASYLNSLGDANNELPVTLAYNCDRRNFLMDGNNAVLDWTASTVGAVNRGARVEISLRGTVRAKFSPASNKLLSANLSFDTGLVSSQTENAVVAENRKPDDEIAAASTVTCDATCEANAILDSLEAMAPMSAIVMDTESDASDTSSQKAESTSECSVHVSAIPSLLE